MKNINIVLFVFTATLIIVSKADDCQKFLKPLQDGARQIENQLTQCRKAEVSLEKKLGKILSDQEKYKTLHEMKVSKLEQDLRSTQNDQPTKPFCEKEKLEIKKLHEVNQQLILLGQSLRDRLKDFKQKAELEQEPIENSESESLKLIKKEKEKLEEVLYDSKRNSEKLTQTIEQLTEELSGIKEEFNDLKEDLSHSAEIVSKLTDENNEMKKEVGKLDKMKKLLKEYKEKIDDPALINYFNKKMEKLSAIAITSSDAAESTSNKRLIVLGAFSAILFFMLVICSRFFPLSAKVGRTALFVTVAYQFHYSWVEPYFLSSFPDKNIKVINGVFWFVVVLIAIRLLRKKAKPKKLKVEDDLEEQRPKTKQKKHRKKHVHEERNGRSSKLD